MKKEVRRGSWHWNVEVFIFGVMYTVDWNSSFVCGINSLRRTVGIGKGAIGRQIDKWVGR